MWMTQKNFKNKNPVFSISEKRYLKISFELLNSIDQDWIIMFLYSISHNQLFSNTIELY